MFEVVRWVLLGAAGIVFAYLGALAAFGLLSRPVPSDLIVVLGNELDAEGTPSPRLRARLDTAAAVFRAGLAPVVLVSGGVEQPGGRDEAAAMARYLVQHGVPGGAVVQDAEGVDTLETARRVAGMLHGGGRVLVVTQWFHVPRTVWVMRWVGQGRVSAAWPRFVEWRDVYSFGREAVALPVWMLRPAGGRSGRVASAWG